MKTINLADSADIPRIAVSTVNAVKTVKQQFTQAQEGLPLCSLQTAAVLALSGNIALVLITLFALPVLQGALKHWGLNAIWFNASVFSALPLLCYLQKTVQKKTQTQTNMQTNMQTKDRYMALPSFQTSLLVLPTLLAVLWSSLQYWGDLTWLNINEPATSLGLKLLRNAVLMWVFSATWLLAYQPPSLAVAEREEADLQHLGAAIRPHFFFNALNAVMVLIRSEPKRAELVLQDTAELFRSVMMQHEQRLVTLATELETCEQYTRIEQARLANRLRLNWQVDSALLAVSVPPFSLQPLIENAIRHGIEPLLDGGEVLIAISRHEKNLVLHVSNPVITALNQYQTARNKQHNGIALENIAARLCLMYDQAASFEHGIIDSHYIAEIVLPLEFNA